MHVYSSFAGHGSRRTIRARSRLSWAVARGPEQLGAQKGGCLRPASGRGQHPEALQVAAGSLKLGFLTYTNSDRGSQHGCRYKSAKLGATWSRLRSACTSSRRAAPVSGSPAWCLPMASRQGLGSRSPRPRGTRRDSHTRSRQAEPWHRHSPPTSPPLTPSQRGDVICLRSRGRSLETPPPTMSALAARCRHQSPTRGDAIRPGFAGGGKGLRAAPLPDRN